MKKEKKITHSDFTEEELKLIKKALTEVVTKRVEKVVSLPDAPVETSDEFNQKMQALIKERKERKKHPDMEKTNDA